MKKLIFLLLWFISLSSHSITWKKIVPLDGYVDNISYDSESIQKDGKFVSVWLKVEGSDIQKRKYDCGNQRYLLLFVKTLYQSPNVNFSNNTEYTGLSIDDKYNINVMKQICGIYGLKP